MAKLTQLSTKGQVVIPSDIREALDLAEGDTLQIERVGDLVVIKRVELPSLKQELERGKNANKAQERGTAEKGAAKARGGGA